MHKNKIKTQAILKDWTMKNVAAQNEVIFKLV